MEFKPLAHLSGGAEVGIIRRTFVDQNAPPYRGSVARADLGYRLFGRTRFGFAAERDLSYSYRPDQRDYVQSAVELSVIQRIASAWDVRGRFRHVTLSYGLTEIAGAPVDASPEERIRSYGVGIGRYVGATRVGLQVNRQTRTSDFSGNRGYYRTQIVSSVEYGF